MPPFPSKDNSQKPHKRTGVWSSDSVKQKVNSAAEKILKQHSLNEIAEISTHDEEDDPIGSSSKTNVNDIIKNRMKSDLYKLPALSIWNDLNVGLLLSQFNDEEDIKEDDTLWSHSTLFAEIVNKLKK